jgi:ubiquitin conjugation factor E4 B
MDADESKDVGVDECSRGSQQLMDVDSGIDTVEMEEPDMVGASSSVMHEGQAVRPRANDLQRAIDLCRRTLALPDRLSLAKSMTGDNDTRASGDETGSTDGDIQSDPNGAAALALEQLVTLVEGATVDVVHGKAGVSDWVNQILMSVLKHLLDSDEPALLRRENSKDSGTGLSDSLSASPSGGMDFGGFMPRQDASMMRNDVLAVTEGLEEGSSRRHVVSLSYLTASYDRLMLERRPSGLVARWIAAGRNENSTDDDSVTQKAADLVSFELHFQILRNIVMLLLGYMERDTTNTSKFLLLHLIARGAVPTGFIDDLMLMTEDEPEEFDGVFRPIAEGLLSVARVLSLRNENFRQTLAILSELAEVKLPETNRRPFCEMLVRMPCWLPDAQTEAVGREISRLSFLGPFFSLSVMTEDDTVTVDHYCYNDHMDDDSAKLQYPIIRRYLEGLRIDVHRICHSLLLNGSTRGDMLNYIMMVIQRNAEKAKLYSADHIVATDGFMLNFISVLYKMAEKVTLDKVNPLYIFHPDTRVIIKDESRLKLRTEELEQFEKDVDTSALQIRFPMECFFLTLHAQHVGLLPVLRRFDHVQRDEIQVRGIIRSMEESQSSWAEDPVQGPRNRIILARNKLIAKTLMRNHFGLEAMLCDELHLSRAFQFCGKVMNLLANLICPDGPRIPVPEPHSRLFGSLPEFYLDDALEFMIFLLHHAPAIMLESSGCFDIAPVLLVFLCQPSLFNNPFIPVRLVEVTFLTTQPSNWKLFRSLLDSPLAPDHLFRSLVKFYSDCEYTGSHTEFYDKFNIRFHIQIIFKSMWHNFPVHRAVMINQYRDYKDEFIRFINMLINDTTFLLDEVLNSLKKIREMQDLMAKSDEWNALSTEEQRHKSQDLSQTEGYVKSFMALTRETLEMFVYMTEQVQEPFLCLELGDRLAAMLNFNLAQLSGPKCRNLRVRNPEKYRFEPRKLLGQLTDIYLHLNQCGSDQFARCIAADERSYSPDLFTDAIGRLNRRQIKTPIEIERFVQLAQVAEAIWKANARAQESLGDIPDEFADPILGTLMLDPLRLPSGHVCDRKVITRHLLSDQSNPFNREKLTEDMLVPETDLKRRIKEWMATKLGGGSG